MKKQSDQLDHIVKNKLDQLHVEHKPQHWAQFEQLLEQREAGVPVVEDRRLDEIIFEKLHNIRVGHWSKHWGLMASQLDEHVNVRRSIVLYKLMEASLVLLLLFAVTQFFPLQVDNPTTHQQPIASQKEGTTTSTAAKTLDVTSTKANNQGVNSHYKNNNTAAEQLVRDDTQAAIAEPNHVQNSLESTGSFPAVTINAQRYSVSPRLSKSALPLHTAKTGVPEIEENPQETASSELGNAIAPRRVDLLNALEQIMVAELQYASSPDYALLLSPLKKRKSLVVGMFGSGDYNQIVTPSSYIGDKFEAAWQRYAPGYGGGLTLGWDVGQWEIGIGASYSAKKYQPRPIVRLGGSFFNGYDGEGLSNIELNMVQLPLYFRYNFIYHNKWRAYATVGFALNVNFQTNYFFADEESFLSPRSQPKPVQEYIPSEELDLPGGWLDGGSLWQNGYISGNLSLGVERYITGRWSIFAQPTYHHSLNYFTQGVGPDKDRLHTMSIFTGVRVRLNN